MKATRQEKLEKYLTPEVRKKFRLKNSEFQIYDDLQADWLPYSFTKHPKKGVKYFSNFKLEKEIYFFLCKYYDKENITTAEVKGIIKLVPFEI